jgi:hypothetical protein
MEAPTAHWNAKTTGSLRRRMAGDLLRELRCVATRVFFALS